MPPSADAPSMLRLRRAAVLAAVLALGATALSASPAAAADQLAACDPATAPGLQWSAPSFLAWGRTARVGANVTDPGDGPGYDDDSVALALDAGSARAADDPVAHDLEFVLAAPAHGDSVNAAANWAMVDETGTVLCAQTAALSIPLGIGETLKYRAKAGSAGVSWVAVGAGDCHDIALQGISLTVSQGGVSRSLSAADQCNPAGHKRVATRDWELTLSGGRFHLNALRPHSSLKVRMRYALRVGPRRVASGSLSLVRSYKPDVLILLGGGQPGFLENCVHGRYGVHWFGKTVGCRIPGSFKIHLSLV
jgi:hypothetical protein